jgi:hypothetical protein
MCIHTPNTTAPFLSIWYGRYKQRSEKDKVKNVNLPPLCSHEKCFSLKALTAARICCIFTNYFRKYNNITTAVTSAAPHYWKAKLWRNLTYVRRSISTGHLVHTERDATAKLAPIIGTVRAGVHTRHYDAPHYVIFSTLLFVASWMLVFFY